jgi:hypothetical protein
MVLRQFSWLVGRNRISLMSTSSGWLMAKTTQRAKESAGIAAFTSPSLIGCRREVWRRSAIKVGQCLQSADSVL